MPEEKTPPNGLDKKILRQALDEIIEGGLNLTSKQLMALLVARIHAVEAGTVEILRSENRARERISELEEKIDKLCKAMEDRVTKTENDLRKLQRDSISHNLRKKADANPIVFWLMSVFYIVLFFATVISDFRHPILQWIGEIIQGVFY